MIIIINNYNIFITIIIIIVIITAGSGFIAFPAFIFSKLVPTTRFI